MNKYFLLSALSIFLGVFLILIQPFTSITGAIIDLSTTYSKLNFFIGLGLVVFGILLIESHLNKK